MTKGQTAVSDSIPDTLRTRSGAGGHMPMFWIQCQFDPQDIPIVPLRSYFERTPAKENLLLTFDEIISDYVRQVRQHSAHGPYYLGGYSIGGLFAIEAARRLQAEGEEVELLFLVDPLLEDERENRRPFLKRMSHHYGSVHQLKKKDRVVRRLHMLAFEALSLNSAVWKRSAHALFRAVERLPRTHRTHHIVTLYRTALARYRAAAYDGNTIIYFRKTHPALKQDGWRRFCAEAEVCLIDNLRHEATIRAPWNRQWMARLARIMARAHYAGSRDMRASGNG